MKRKIYARLIQWKNSDKGSCALLIDGARRVGKSYIAEEFAKNEYRSYIMIDFAKAPRAIINIFENDSHDLDLFYHELSAYYRTKLYPRDSLIIFDEVQRYARARELIKYFVADGRYDFLETGSLISLKKNVEDIVIPSEEEHLKMFPMDFEEFLWAMGDESTIPYLQMCFEERRPVGQAMHRRVMNDYRQYMMTGGMPQVVENYLSSRDFSSADRIKGRILDVYRQDIHKFAYEDAARVISLFDELPSQLAKKEKTYKLASIKKGSRFADYEDAFLWLDEAMVVNNCRNATDPTVGLRISEDHTTRKTYMGDTGLLITHAFRDKSYTENDLYRAILLDKIHVNEGMLAENLIAQQLRAAGHNLFFYSRSDTTNRENHMEIDFLIRQQNKVCPVEVKSGANKKRSSLDKFRTKFKGRLGTSYLLYPKDIMEKEGILHLPLYMAMFL